MLEIRNLTKQYGSNTAVRSVNLSIREGEFFSLLGPSGCGKTTLLRMIGGFESPTSGEILFDGQRVDQLPPYERPFNMVFQRYALFPHLNVWDNVAFGPKMKSVPRPELRSRVEEALALVKMEEYARRSVTTLSGGQQQRIAVARALVNRPKVLLLDEPLSALDLKLRQQMQVELLALQRRLKTTFIFVTHDQEEALTLSDRIAVMSQGDVEQEGNAEEIYEHPRTHFVAQFIGSINAIDASVESATPEAINIRGVAGAENRSLQVRPSRDGKRRLPGVEPGVPVKVMIRPEKLTIQKTAPAASTGKNYLEGIFREVLYQGSITQIYVEPKGSGPVSPLIVAQPNNGINGVGKRAFSPGEKVIVSWFPEDSLLLSRDGASLG